MDHFINSLHRDSLSTVTDLLFLSNHVSSVKAQFPGESVRTEYLSLPGTMAC